MRYYFNKSYLDGQHGDVLQASPSNTLHSYGVSCTISNNTSVTIINITKPLIIASSRQYHIHSSLLVNCKLESKWELLGSNIMRWIQFVELDTILDFGLLDQTNVVSWRNCGFVLEIHILDTAGVTLDFEFFCHCSVSYTHLTLPTILHV